MNARRFALSCFVVALALTAAIGESSHLLADGTYVDPMGRFSFSLPASWSLVAQPPNDPQQGPVVIGASNGDSFVVKTTSAEGKSASQITTDERLVVKMHAGYMEDPAGIQDAMVGGVPAKSFAYTWMDNGMIQVIREFVVISMGTVYKLIFTTTPANADAFAPPANSVLNSWQFA